MITSFPSSKPYPRTVKARGKPRTQETPCPTCGGLLWQKETLVTKRRFFCPDCHKYYTFQIDPNGANYTNEGSAAWQALSSAAPDDLEWTGTLGELLAELDEMERAEHDAAWRVWCELRNQ